MATARNTVAARAAQAQANQAATATVPDLLKNFSGEISKALPKGMEAVQFTRDAMTAFKNSPKLREVDPTSFMGALMTCAQLGLRPGVGALGEAWILPFKGQAQFIIGYQGMISLAHRSGLLDSVTTRMVHENDEFSVQYGTEDKLVHRPPTKGPRGEAIGYYCVVKVKGGGYVFEYMTRQEMEAHRDEFAMARSGGRIVGPWRDNFDAMARKTMVRRLWPYMPRSAAMTLAQAADSTVRVDLVPDADLAAVTQRVEDAELLEDDGTPAPEDDQ